MNEFFDELFKHWRVKKTAAAAAAVVTVDDDDGDEETNINLGDIFEVKGEEDDDQVGEPLPLNDDPYLELDFPAENDCKAEVHPESVSSAHQEVQASPSATPSPKCTAPSPQAPVAKVTFTLEQSDQGIDSKIARLKLLVAINSVTFDGKTQDYKQ